MTIKYIGTLIWLSEDYHAFEMGHRMQVINPNFIPKLRSSKLSILMNIILKLYISKIIGYSVVDILYITVVSCSGG